MEKGFENLEWYASICSTKHPVVVLQIVTENVYVPFMNVAVVQTLDKTNQPIIHDEVTDGTASHVTYHDYEG